MSRGYTKRPFATAVLAGLLLTFLNVFVNIVLLHGQSWILGVGWFVLWVGLFVLLWKRGFPGWGLFVGWLLALFIVIFVAAIIGYVIFTAIFGPAIPPATP